MLTPLKNLMFPIQYLEVCDSLIRTHDGDLAEFHRQCGVSTQDLLDVSGLIDGEQLLTAYTLTQKFCTPDRPAVLQILEHFPLTAHGMLGMLALASNTLGDALNAALEFIPLIMPAFHVTRQNNGDRVNLIFERTTDFGEQNAFFTEMIMAGLHKIVPFTHMPLDEIEASFQHPAPPYVEIYEQTLQISRLIYDADHNRITLPRKLLNTPLITQSPTLHRMLEKELRNRAQHAAHLKPVSQRVRRLLHLYLDENRIIAAEHIAHDMHFSQRTLTRRLGEEGTSLTQLHQEVAISYAEQLLLTTNRAIADIASKTGFGHAANFTRTFKRLTGTTPSDYRNKKNP